MRIVFRHQDERHDGRDIANRTVEVDYLGPESQDRPRPVDTGWLMGDPFYLALYVVYFSQTAVVQGQIRLERL